MRKARKAAIGYVTYAVARRVVRRKTRDALRRLGGDTPRRSRRGPLVGAAALAATATAGAVVLHRRRPHGE
jgi:hypothetical protein